MFRPRVIPCLLLENRRLIKTVRFENGQYVGDPINTLRIFNEKEVDEIAILDTAATVKNKAPDFDLIAELASECFMPLAYGGGIKTVDAAKKILNLGIEKIIINSQAVKEPQLIKKIADMTGSSSVVVSIDVKRNIFGQYQIFIEGGEKKTGISPVEFAVKMQTMGAGEILLNSIDRDGVMGGYDLQLIKMVTDAVDIPVIACGGAGSIQHFSEALSNAKAAAVAAGSFFVFHGKHKAVLISYPNSKELLSFSNER